MVEPSLLLLALADHDQRVCFAYNADSREVIYLNAVFESFFQVDLKVNVDTIMNMVHLDDKPYLKQRYRQMEPNRLEKDIEFRVMLPDGKEAAAKLSMITSLGDNCELLITGYLEDITGYKAHNDKLNEFTNKKNSIMNILSHDLAGPLSSIQNYAVILSRKTKSLQDEQLNKLVSSIERVSKKGINLIQEFIKQEFIESAGVDLVKIRCELVKIFETLIEEYQESENDMGKTFRLHANKEHLYVEIDESKFMQAINNLISNAIKFTADGGEIILGLEANENKILVTVADTSVGIPKKFHANLFDKFNNARRTGLKGEPSIGLGMSIIKTIVEWHQGKIWFVSKENKGTTFYIEISKSL